jgi:hypothetical protein
MREIYINATSAYLYSKKEIKSSKVQWFKLIWYHSSLAASTLTTLFVTMYKFEKDGMVLFMMLTLT